VIVDDNALFRQPDIAARVRASFPRPEEETERERSGLELIPLPGTVGLISGGAGMTLATMDLLKESGADPACFLDCSANPTKAGYGRALEYVQHAPAVNVVLISIFGGLTRIDKVAQNICELLADGACTKPVVFRLMGAAVAEATMTLSQFGYANHEKLEDAVAEVVTTAQALQANGNPGV
jgi:succinyl-CoA synthetase beta subunit